MSDAPSSDTIAVYGATGFTGRLMVRQLAQGEIPFVIAGRNEEQLREFADELHTAPTPPDVAVASVNEPTQLDELLCDVDLVINCAGPFAELGAPVVQSALRTKTHYLDTSGEQEHIRWVAESCHEQALQKEIILMPACAFEFALGDLAAEIALAQAASRIVVAYAVKDFKMSHGTKKSLVRTLAEGGLTFRGGKHRKKRTGYTTFDVPFPNGSFHKGFFVPGGEAITVPRRGGVSRVETCVVADEGMANFGAQLLGFVPSLVRLLKPITDRVVEQTSSNPHSVNSGESEFLVIAFDPKNNDVHVILRGKDPYVTTVNIAVEAARQILTGVPVRSGFVGPADLFDPVAFFEAVGVAMYEGEDEEQ